MAEATISENLIAWLMNMIYLTVIIVTVSGLIFGIIVTTVNVRSPESHILLQRLEYSRQGIVEYDSEIQRAYPGIVDSSKISMLENAALTKDGIIAAKFVIDGKEYYLNREKYGIWRPIAEFTDKNQDVKGSSAKFSEKELRYVYAEGPAYMESVVIS